MERIFFEGSSSEEFMAKLCFKLKEIIKSYIEDNHNQEPEKLLTREETAKFLKVSLPTLNNWTKAKVLTPHHIGRRVYYKKSEIINKLKNQ